MLSGARSSVGQSSRLIIGRAPARSSTQCSNDAGFHHILRWGPLAVFTSCRGETLTETHSPQESGGTPARKTGALGVEEPSHTDRAPWADRPSFSPSRLLGRVYLGRQIAREMLQIRKKCGLMNANDVKLVSESAPRFLRNSEFVEEVAAGGSAI